MPDGHKISYDFFPGLIPPIRTRDTMPSADAGCTDARCQPDCRVSPSAEPDQVLSQARPSCCEHACSRTRETRSVSSVPAAGTSGLRAPDL
eukprot:2135639-Rhodomonas_salina.2